MREQLREIIADSDSQKGSVINCLCRSVWLARSPAPCGQALLLSTNRVINGGQHSGHRRQSSMLFIPGSAPRWSKLPEDPQRECLNGPACLQPLG